MENCGSAVGYVIRLFTWPSDQPRHATKHLNLPDRNQIAPKSNKNPKSRRKHSKIILSTKASLEQGGFRLFVEQAFIFLPTSMNRSVCIGPRSRLIWNAYA